MGLLAASCGDEEREIAATSSGGDGGVDAGLVIPTPPPPQMTSWACPPGWLPEPMLEGTDLEYSICIPPPLPASCPDGTMPVLGESACQPIGDPCPAGDWPAALPGSGSVIYVKAGAMSGDGSSPSAPLGSIGAAVRAAPSGAVIAIAKGRYAEAVVLTSTLTLWGACVTGVTIDGPTGEMFDATIAVLGPGSGTIRNVTVTGSRVGLIVDGAGTLEAAGIRVGAATGVGVLALGGNLELQGVAVTDTQPLPNGAFGRGLNVESGASATVRRALLDHNRDLSVFAGDGGTELMLADVVVRDTQPRESDQGFGRGLFLAHGAHATVERALFDRNHDAGVGAGDVDTDLTLTDVIVRDTQSQASDKLWGRGLSVQSGAHATVQRAVFQRNRDVGVYVAGGGTDVALTEVVVEDTHSRATDARFGRGLSVQSGARAIVERALLQRNREAGVVGVETGTELMLTDVVVADTQARDDNGEHGVGVSAAVAARVELRSARISGNRVAGILVMSSGELTVTACEVTATKGGSVTLLGPDGVTLDGPHYDDIGDGILVVGGSSATLSDVRIAECTRAGALFADSGGSLASVTSTANRYGLATQGSPQPSYDAATCNFSGNTELGILTDGNLPVPNAPLGVPDAP